MWTSPSTTYPLQLSWQDATPSSTSALVRCKWWMETSWRTLIFRDDMTPSFSIECELKRRLLECQVCLRCSVRSSLSLLCQYFWRTVCSIFNSMADWTQTICHMLMQMAKRSLFPGGKLIINEVNMQTWPSVLLLNLLTCSCYLCLLHHDTVCGD